MLYSQNQVIVTWGNWRLAQLAKDGQYSVSFANDQGILTEGNNGDHVFSVDVRKGASVKVQVMPGSADSLYLTQQALLQQRGGVPLPKSMVIQDPLNGRHWAFPEAVIKKVPDTTFALEIGSEEWEFLAIGARKV